MNVQENLFKIYNVVKHQSADWDKILAESKDKKEIDPMVLYYAAYFGGGKDIAKILINLWNGDLTDEELAESLKMLHNPTNEKKIS